MKNKLNFWLTVLVITVAGLCGCVENIYGQAWVRVPDNNTGTWYIINTSYTYTDDDEGQQKLDDFAVYMPSAASYSATYDYDFKRTNPGQGFMCSNNCYPTVTLSVKTSPDKSSSTAFTTNLLPSAHQSQQADKSGTATISSFPICSTIQLGWSSSKCACWTSSSYHEGTKDYTFSIELPHHYELSNATAEYTYGATSAVAIGSNESHEFNIDDYFKTYYTEGKITIKIEDVTGHTGESSMFHIGSASGNQGPTDIVPADVVYAAAGTCSTDGIARSDGNNSKKTIYYVPINYGNHEAWLNIYYNGGTTPIKQIKLKGSSKWPSLDQFSNTDIGGVSAKKDYTLSLCSTTGNLTVTAPNGYLVSNDDGSTWRESVVVNNDNNNAQFSVRYVPNDAADGDYVVVSEANGNAVFKVGVSNKGKQPKVLPLNTVKVCAGKNYGPNSGGWYETNIFGNTTWPINVKIDEATSAEEFLIQKDAGDISGKKYAYEINVPDANRKFRLGYFPKQAISQTCTLTIKVPSTQSSSGYKYYTIYGTGTGTMQTLDFSGTQVAVGNASSDEKYINMQYFRASYDNKWDVIAPDNYLIRLPNSTTWAKSVEISNGDANSGKDESHAKFFVKFVPESSTTPDGQFTLRDKSTNLNKGDYTFNVKGTATAAPTITLTESTVAGSVSAQTERFELTNFIPSGGLKVEVINSSGSTPNYVVCNTSSNTFAQNCTIPAAQTTKEFYVKFSPQIGITNYNETIRVTDLVTLRTYDIPVTWSNPSAYIQFSQNVSNLTVGASAITLNATLVDAAGNDISNGATITYSLEDFDDASNPCASITNNNQLNVLIAGTATLRIQATKTGYSISDLTIPITVWAQKSSCGLTKTEQEGGTTSEPFEYTFTYALGFPVSTVSVVWNSYYKVDRHVLSDYFYSYDSDLTATFSKQSGGNITRQASFTSSSSAMDTKDEYIQTSSFTFNETENRGAITTLDIHIKVTESSSYTPNQYIKSLVVTQSQYFDKVTTGDIDFGSKVIFTESSQHIEMDYSDCGTITAALSSESGEHPEDFAINTNSYSTEDYEYTISTPQCSFGTLRIPVYFKPSGEGERTCTLTLTPTNGTAQTYVLKGTGIKRDQIISFTSPDKTYVYQSGGRTVALAATTNVTPYTGETGLDSYTYSIVSQEYNGEAKTDIASLNGNQLTLTNVGTVLVKATNTGTDYTKAAEALFYISVTPADKTITWTDNSKTLTTCTGNPVELDATVTGDNQTITYNLALPTAKNDCATNLDNILTQNGATVTFKSGYPTAVIDVTATSSATRNYKAAEAVTGTITVNPCSSQAVTWNQTLTGLYYGDKIVLTSASSTYETPGGSTYSYNFANNTIAAAADSHIKALKCGSTTATATQEQSTCYNDESVSSNNAVTVSNTDQKVYFEPNCSTKTASPTIPAFDPNKHIYYFNDGLPAAYAIDKRHSTTSGCGSTATYLTLTNGEHKTGADLGTPALNISTDNILSKYSSAAQPHIAFINSEGKLVVTGYGSGTVSLTVGANATAGYNAVSVDADKAALTVTIDKIDADVEISTDNTTTDDRYYGDVEAISYVKASLKGTSNEIKDYESNQIYASSDFTLTPANCSLSANNSQIQFNTVGNNVKVTASLPADNLIKTLATANKSFTVTSTDQKVYFEPSCSTKTSSSIAAFNPSKSRYVFGTDFPTPYAIDKRHSTTSGCGSTATYLTLTNGEHKTGAGLSTPALSISTDNILSKYSSATQPHIAFIDSEGKLVVTGYGSGTVSLTVGANATTGYNAVSVDADKAALTVTIDKIDADVEISTDNTTTADRYYGDVETISSINAVLEGSSDIIKDYNGGTIYDATSDFTLSATNCTLSSDKIQFDNVGNNVSVTAKLPADNLIANEAYTSKNFNVVKSPQAIVCTEASNSISVSASTAASQIDLSQYLFCIDTRHSNSTIPTTTCLGYNTYLTKETKTIAGTSYSDVVVAPTKLSYSIDASSASCGTAPSIDANGILTLTGTGGTVTVTVTATDKNADGTSSYYDNTNVTTTFQVVIDKLTPTLSLNVNGNVHTLTETDQNEDIYYGDEIPLTAIAKITSSGTESPVSGTTWTIVDGSEYATQTGNTLKAIKPGSPVRINVNQPVGCLVAQGSNNHYTFTVKKAPAQIVWQQTIDDYTTRNTGNVPELALTAVLFDTRHSSNPSDVTNISYSVSITNKGCSEVAEADIAYVSNGKLYVPGGTSADVTITATHDGKTTSGIEGYDLSQQTTPVSKTFHISKVTPTISLVTKLGQTVSNDIRYGDKVTLSATSAIEGKYASTSDATFTYTVVDATYGEIQNNNEFLAKKVGTAQIKVSQAATCLTEAVVDQIIDINVEQCDQRIVCTSSDKSVTFITKTRKSSNDIKKYSFCVDTRHSNNSITINGQACQGIPTFLQDTSSVKIYGTKYSTGVKPAPCKISYSISSQEPDNSTNCQGSLVSSISGSKLNEDNGVNAGTVTILLETNNVQNTDPYSSAEDETFSVIFSRNKIPGVIELSTNPTVAVTGNTQFEVEYGDIIKLIGYSYYDQDGTRYYDSNNDNTYSTTGTAKFVYSVNSGNKFGRIIGQGNDQFEAIGIGLAHLTIKQNISCKAKETTDNSYSINVSPATRTVVWNNKTSYTSLTSASPDITLDAYTVDKNSNQITSGGGTVTYSIENATDIPNAGLKCVELSSDNKTLIIKGSGTATVKVSFGVANYKAIEDTWTFTITDEAPTLNITPSADIHITSTDENVDMLQYFSTTNYNGETITETVSQPDGKSDFLEIASNTLKAFKEGTSIQVPCTVEVTTRYLADGTHPKTTGNITFDITKGTLYFNVTGGGNWIDKDKWSRPDIVQKHIKNNDVDLSAYNVNITQSCFIGTGKNTSDQGTYEEWKAHRVNASCNDLTIDGTDAKLVIGESSTLNVGGTFANTDASKFYLTANHWGQASVVFASGSPKATVEMYIPAGSGSRTNPIWQYRGIIVSDENFTATYGPWENMAIYEWTEADNGNLTHGCWNLVTNTGSALSAIKLKPWVGYAFANMTSTPDYTWLRYTGTLLNTATKEYSLTKTNTKRADGTLYANNGVNLLTNSFAAPMTIGEGSFTNANATVTFFNAGTYNDWKTEQGTSVQNQHGDAGQMTVCPKITSGTAQNTYTIPSGQSFFVTATDDTDGNGHKVSFTYADVKANLAPSSRMFMPLEQDNEPKYNVLGIRVAKDSTKGDRLALIECDSCTRQYDNGYDGYKMKGNDSLPQLYAYNKFGITAVNADSTFNKQYIGFTAGSDDETYTISFETDRLFGYHSLYLTDRKLNQTVDILAGETYQFQGYTVGENTRFQINGITEEEWENNDDDNEDENSGNECDLRVVNNTLYVQGFTTYDYPATDIQLFDMTGNLVWSTPLTAARVYDLPDLPHGIYMIRLGDCHVKLTSMK